MWEFKFLQYESGYLRTFVRLLNHQDLHPLLERKAVWWKPLSERLCLLVPRK